MNFNDMDARTIRERVDSFLASLAGALAREFTLAAKPMGTEPSWRSDRPAARQGPACGLNDRAEGKTERVRPGHARQLDLTSEDLAGVKFGPRHDPAGGVIGEIGIERDGEFPEHGPTLAGQG